MCQMSVIPDNATIVDIQVCGDHWLNTDPAQQQLDQISDPDIPLLLRVNSEGPSLGALGVIDMVMRHCQRTGRDPTKIMVQSWLNEVEIAPFQKIGRFLYSHFFWMSRRYWQHDPQPNTQEHRFGLFVGRRTLPRRVIMHHMWHQYRDTSLLSVMRDPIAMPAWGVDLDLARSWHSNQDHQEFDAWWQSPPVDSIDSMSVGAQYQADQNTNLSVLGHYHRFGLELVCESYCRGETFFVTEKTVRPMVGMKPMIVYGPRRYLERLRNHGFRTWQELWSENYDRYEGPERWEVIKILLESLYAMPHEEYWHMMDRAQDIAVHNLAVLKDLVKENWTE